MVCVGQYEAHVAQGTFLHNENSQSERTTHALTELPFDQILIALDWASRGAFVAVPAYSETKKGIHSLGDIASATPLVFVTRRMLFPPQAMGIICE
jgi:hypothetical protein